MRRLDRYLGSEVLRHALLALVALTGLDAFFALLAELGELGQEGYGLGDAFAYVALTLPRRLYNMVPMAALIGGLLGLGGMAGRNELVAMRAAGVSQLRIGRAVLQAGLVLVAIAAVLGEFVAPPAERAAQNLRMATAQQTPALSGRSGLWARDGRDYVQIRYVLPGGDLRDVSIHQFDEQRRLLRTLRAVSGRVVDGRWVLRDVAVSTFVDGGVETAREPELGWPTRLEPRLLDVVSLQPEQQSIRELRLYISYLESNGLAAGDFAQALWNRLLAPLEGLVMLLVALPFVFGAQRRLPVGKRVVAGIALGLLFMLVNRVVGQAGSAFDLDPLFSAALPSLLFAGTALAVLRRIP